MSTGERTSEAADAPEPPAPPSPPAPIVPTTVRRSGRHRRPSGAAPPLPRNLGSTGKGLLVVLAALLDLGHRRRRVASRPPGHGPARRALPPPHRPPAHAVADDGVPGHRPHRHRLAGRPSPRCCLIVALIVLRRWRHLFTFLGSVLVLELVGRRPARRLQPPPSLRRDHPRSLEGLLVALAAGGRRDHRPRRRRLHPGRGRRAPAGEPRSCSSCWWRCTPSPGSTSRWTTPSTCWWPSRSPSPSRSTRSASSPPTRSSRSRTARARRPTSTSPARAARRSVQAVQDQLGLTVLDLKPVGLAGSGGSTPLRLRVAGDPDEYLFGKLYAMSHVRADRWYKMGRTVLYGRLEDEAPFQSVRRLVEYEDYALRLMRDAGIHTAAAYGIVEMTPEREYLLVTEFFDGAQGDRRRRRRRQPHRPGTAAGPPALGRRPGPPRHQAGQPAGPGRRAARSSTWRSRRCDRRRGGRPSTWPT